MKSFQIVLVTAVLLLLGYTQIQLTAIRHSLDAGGARPIASAVSSRNDQCTPQLLIRGESNNQLTNTSERPKSESVAASDQPQQASTIDAVNEENNPGMQIVENVFALAVVERGDIQKAISQLSTLPDTQRKQALQQFTQRINNQELHILPAR